jgi:hypothetical protein
MIIWGFRMIYRALASGVFLCPDEGDDRPYALKSRQRFFTLFFIPLIPLKKFGNIVECQSCRTKYEETVLARPTGAQRANSFVDGVRGAVVALLRAGSITDETRRRAVGLMTHYIPEYNDAMLQSDYQQMDLGLLQPQLHVLAATLDTAGKESLLTHFTLVAIADKENLNEAERSILEHCGHDLGMTEVHCKGTIQNILDSGPHS